MLIVSPMRGVRTLLAGLMVGTALTLVPAGPAAAAQPALPDAAITARQSDSPTPPPVSPASYPGDPDYSTVPADPGVTAAMDTDVTSANVSDIPLSVQPGDTFTVGIDAASGAHCAGTITFRGPPPVELPDVAANGEVCSWSVTAPLVARAGTAIVDAQVSRGGQSWRVAGVVYVNPPGESR